MRIDRCAIGQGHVGTGDRDIASTEGPGASIDCSPSDSHVGGLDGHVARIGEEELTHTRADGSCDVDGFSGVQGDGTGSLGVTSRGQGTVHDDAAPTQGDVGVGGSIMCIEQ